MSDTYKPDLVTEYEFEDFFHRTLWGTSKRMAELSKATDKEWHHYTIAAMVFAFHTVEAYCNYIGDVLDPDTWQNEQSYFKKNGGVKGKIRFVMSLVGLQLKDTDRPLKTVFEMKTFRDLIAHGRTTKLSGKVIQRFGTGPTERYGTGRQLVP